MKVTVSVDLEPRAWYALAEVADRLGVKVADLLAPGVAEAVGRLTATETDRRGRNPYAKDRPYEDPIRREVCRRMWIGGHSSVAIGRRLATTNLRKVRATLWDLGFDPRTRIGHPPAGHRARPVHRLPGEQEAIAS